MTLRHTKTRRHLVLIAALLLLVTVVLYAYGACNNVKFSRIVVQLYSAQQDGQFNLVDSLCPPETARWFRKRDKLIGRVVSFKIESVSSLPFGVPSCVVLKVKRTSGDYEELVEGLTSGIEQAWVPKMVDGETHEHK